MNKGILYGVGVGPGDPRLMTLLAVETVARCPVVAAPRTRSGAMVALDIAAGTADLSEKTVVPLDFAMTRDAAERAALHQQAAETLRFHLDRGESVALLNLGDISLYASFQYVADILGPEGYTMEMIPGVTSFCAAAAALGVGLTTMDGPVRIIPDGDAGEPGAPGTTIWMKSGRNLPALLERLKRDGTARDAMLVQNCGMRDQRIYHGVEGETIEPAYFTVTIVKTPQTEGDR